MENKPKNPHAVALGRLGGKAGTGAAKVRKVTTEQARAAALARWAKRGKVSVTVDGVPATISSLIQMTGDYKIRKQRKVNK